MHAFTAPPTQRHTIYQLVDIEIPEVQRLLIKKNANYDVRVGSIRFLTEIPL